MLAAAGSVGMAGLLGHEWGFSRSLRKAPVFYGLVALGTLGGTALSLLHINPIHLLVLVAVINGVAAAGVSLAARNVSSGSGPTETRRGTGSRSYRGCSITCLVAALNNARFLGSPRRS